MLIIPVNSINFKSNMDRDIEMAIARALRAEQNLRRQAEQERIRQEQERIRQEQERIRQAEQERIRQEQIERAKREEELRQNRIRVLDEIQKEILTYPDLDDGLSKKMAGFLSQFTCSIQNASEHDIQEFFGDEETAAKLRNKLSPECQCDSIKLREELQQLDEMQDPVMMLIAANNMKKFAPKAGILNAEQETKFLEGLKDTILLSIKNTDLTKFDDDDRIAINEMVQMIKVAESVDFGISVKLKALVDKLNKKKLKIGFIPPVQVRQFDVAMATNKIMPKIK